MKKLISLVAVILISLNSYSVDTIPSYTNQLTAIDNTVNVSLLDYSDISEITVGDVLYETVISCAGENNFTRFEIKVESVDLVNDSFNIIFLTYIGVNGLYYNNTYINEGAVTKTYGLTSTDFDIYLNVGNINYSYVYFNFSLNSTVGFGDNIKSEPTINIFPNPVVNELNITSTDLSNEVKIYDMTGKMIFNEIITSNDKIDMTPYPKGTYIVIIDDRISRKVIKQ